VGSIFISKAIIATDIPDVFYKLSEPLGLFLLGIAVGALIFLLIYQFTFCRAFTKMRSDFLELLSVTKSLMNERDILADHNSIAEFKAQQAIKLADEITSYVKTVYGNDPDFPKPPDPVGFA